MARNLACAGVFVTLGLASACGDERADTGAVGIAEASRSQSFALAEGDPVTASTDLTGITFRDGTCGNSVTPTAIPAQGSKLEKIRLKFCVTVNVDSGKTFAYDKTKWGAWIGNDKNTFYVGAERIDIEADDNRLAGTEATRSGEITLAIKLPENKLPDAVYGQLGSTSDGSSGRKRLAITPFYSSAGKPPGDTTSREGLRPAYMQNDIGAISAPPSIAKVTTSDGEFVVELGKPASLTSVDPRDAALKSESSVSGYLVMYWNHDECQAAGSWDFRANSTFDKNVPKDASAATLGAAFTCRYPGAPTAQGAAPCAFGCSATKTPNYFNRSEEEILVPREIPAAAGQSVKTGCYTVARIDASRTSYGVSGVENGSNYGVSVFALDSAGRVGQGRSECASVTPRDIPLASKEKGADISRSDCFVVTAASGDSGSAAVHAWRVARDAYIERTAMGRLFVGWYYERGPALARWVDSHPNLKGPLNATFEWSGRAFLRTARFTRVAGEFFASLFDTLFDTLFVSTAHAQGVFGDDPVDGEPTGLAPSGALYLLVSVRTPTDDTNLYKAYYPKKRPIGVTLGQTFRLLDAGGELGVGAEVSYLGTTGKVPERTVRGDAEIPGDVQGRRISFYSLGLAVVSDYRLRIGATPWLAPRVAVFAGAQRMREEVANSQDPNAKGSDQSAQVGNLGAEGWGGLLGVRGSLEISALRAWGADAGPMRYSYGLEDLALSLHVGYTKDFAKKMLRVSGIQGGAGFVFLFL